MINNSAHSSIGRTLGSQPRKSGSIPLWVTFKTSLIFTKEKLDENCNLSVVDFVCGWLCYS